jgi:lysophospholipase L1-like esterase
MKMLLKRTWVAFCFATLLTSASVYAEEAPVRVLMIGDSISLQGYTKYAAETLKDEMLLHHHEGNSQTTRNGLAKLDAWLAEADGNWDVIHFNWGLWDLRSQGTHVPLAEYTANMEKLVARLKKTKATLIFATTTPVPPKNGFKRRDSDVQAYNAAAVAIMKREGIAIDDLYSFIKPTLAKHQRNNDVHFNQAGYQRMGESVVVSLRAAVKK